MKRGGDPRRRRRAAAALVALTFLPVAFIVGISQSGAHASPLPSAASTTANVHALDANPPSVEAIRRGQESNLFAPFSWDGLICSGPFIRFGYLADTGTFLNYDGMNGTQATTLLQSVQISEFAPAAIPVVSGATFIASSRDVTVTAHDEPMGLLEIRTIDTPHTVTIELPSDTSELRVSYSTTWPSSSISFVDQNVSGRIILGTGNLTISGTRVTASLAGEDYLAVRALPAFVEQPSEHEAILDAFASGRLAAEIEFVAVSSGGWIENFAEYHDSVGTINRTVGFGNAAVQLDLPRWGGGLVLLAFDPKTMPADSTHRLVVRANASEVPLSSEPLASLWTTAGSGERPLYTRLALNATVLAVYVPALNATSLQIQSIEVPPPGMSRATQFAIAAAMFVVAVAAVIMFRRDAA